MSKCTVLNDDDISPTASATSFQELSGQDGGIITRIKKMRDLIQSLRLKLAAEKEKLAKERMDAERLLMYQSATTMKENLTTLHSFHSIPIWSENYSFTGCMWEPVNNIRDGQIQQACYYDNNMYYRSPSPYISSTGSDIYKQRLQIVENMCEEEFKKIQYSINSLRINKQYLRERNSDNERGYIPSDYVPHQNLPQKHRKRGVYQRQTYYGNERRQKMSSFYVQDDPFTLNQHREHYCYHYKKLPKKRCYLDSGIDRTHVQCFPVSSKSSDPLFYLDYSHCSNGKNISNDSTD